MEGVQTLDLWKNAAPGEVRLQKTKSKSLKRLTTSETLMPRNRKLRERAAPAQLRSVDKIIEDPGSFHLSASHPEYLAFALSLSSLGSQDGCSSSKHLIFMQLFSGRKQDMIQVPVYDQRRLCQRLTASFSSDLVDRNCATCAPKLEGDKIVCLTQTNYELPPKDGKDTQSPLKHVAAYHLNKSSIWLQARNWEKLLFGMQPTIAATVSIPLEKSNYVNISK